MRWWPFPWPRGWRREKPPEGEGEVLAEDEEKPKSLREQVILFARDLAVAFVIVAIVMGILVGYTRVWPPMVVVESSSMQHSNAESFVGVIDTGDLVLVQAVGQPSDVVTYVQGRLTGHQTYSAYGDVIVFHKPGDLLSSTPIIHRAIVYVVWKPGGMDVPSLAGRGPQEWTGIWAGNSSVATTPYGLSSLTVKSVLSWDLQAGGRRDVTYNLTAFTASGFLTKGDHNPQPDNWSAPVAVGRIVGKARGELPWFGLIKLTLAPGSSGCCPNGWGDTRAPANSWDALLISLILVIAGPFVIEFAFTYWKRRRKAEKPAPAPEASESPPDPPAAPEDPPAVAESAPPTPEVTDEAQTGSSEPGAGAP